MLVANHLGIPFKSWTSAWNTRSALSTTCLTNTPQANPQPDVLTNREVKFDLFLDAALKVGADTVATGHSCRRATDDQGVHHLKAGLDNNKDQSYFLCQLNQAQLGRALFPIGRWKSRKSGPSPNRPAWPRRTDSQGLCFIGKVRLPDFLQQQLSVKQGDIVEIQGHTVFQRSDDNLESSSRPFALKPDMGQG